MTARTLQLTLLFLLRGNEVLLAMKKRGFGEGRWNGVGGKIEPGESLEEAMVRECQEEIYATPTKYQKKAEISFLEQHEGEEKPMLVHVYTCSEWIGEAKESEEMRPKWFGLDEIPYDDLWPDDKFWLKQVLDGQSLKANFVLDKEDNIVSHEVIKHEGDF